MPLIDGAYFTLYMQTARKLGKQGLLSGNSSNTSKVFKGVKWPKTIKKLYYILLYVKGGKSTSYLRTT